MKKILAILLPGLLIFALIAIDHFLLPKDSLYLMVYIYFAFPVIFILQGIAYARAKNSLLTGFLLSAIAVRLPVALWYKVGSVTIAILIYLSLGLLAYFLSAKFLSGKDKA